MKSHKQVIVKPVPRESVQGRHNQTYHVFDKRTGEVKPTEVMGKVKETGAAETLFFQEDIMAGKLVTGLEEMVPNPFIGMELDDLQDTYGLPNSWVETGLLAKLLQKDKISKQRELEILAGTDIDFYTTKINKRPILSNSIFADTTESVFTELQRFKVILYDGANIFQSNTPRGRLAIQLVKNHALIAPDRNGINKNEHHFYVAEEQEEQMDKLRLDRLVNDAVFNYESIKRTYPPFKLYQIGILLKDSNNIPVINSEAGENTVEEKINRFIKDKTTKQLRNIEFFNSVVELLKEQPERFHIEYLVRQAENNRVISIKNGLLMWHSKSEEPELYRFSSLEKFTAFMMLEYEKFDPSDELEPNAYKDMINELESKGVRVTQK